VWTMALGEILTLDNLRKRKVILVDWCSMCKRSGKFIDHLSSLLCSGKRIMDCDF
jgi:hypothetical protein